MKVDDRAQLLGRLEYRKQVRAVPILARDVGADVDVTVEGKLHGLPGTGRLLDRERDL
jgi:hypothetical protein